LDVTFRRNITWKDSQRRSMRSSLDAPSLVKMCGGPSISSDVAVSADDREKQDEDQLLRARMLAKYGMYCEELGARPCAAVRKLIGDGTLASNPIVDLAHFGLGDLGTAPVGRLLQMSKNLRCLNLADNLLTDAGLLCLLEDLHSHVNLCSLELQGNSQLSDRSTHPLLRHLIEVPSLVSIGVEKTHMNETMRMVLYLQAYSNRCEIRRKRGSLLPEQQPSKLRARVEDIARRFSLCSQGFPRAPAIGLVPEPQHEDTWAWREDFEHAVLLQRHWYAQHSRVADALKRRAHARRVERMECTHARWSTFVQCYLKRVGLRMDRSDASTIFLGCQLDSKARLPLDILRLQRWVEYVMSRGSECSQDFVQDVQERIKTKTECLNRLIRLTRLFRAVFWLNCLSRSFGREAKTRVLCISSINLYALKKNELEDLADELDQLQDRCVRANVDQDILLLAEKSRETCTAIISRKAGYMSVFRQAGRKTALMSCMSSDHSSKKLKAQAVALESRVKDQLKRMDLWEQAGDSSVGVNEIETLTRALASNIKMALTDFRAFVDMERIDEAATRLEIYQTLCNICTRERSNVAMVSESCKDIFNVVRFPHEVKSGLMAVHTAFERIETLRHTMSMGGAILKPRKGNGASRRARRSSDNSTEVQEAAGRFTGGTRLLESTLAEVRAELLPQLETLKKDLDIARTMLNQDPQFFALSDREIQDGRILGVLLPLHKALCNLKEGVTDRTRVLSMVCDCQNRLGISPRRRAMSHRRFAGAADEDIVTYEVASERLLGLRVATKTIKDLFDMLQPFSFSNLRRFLLAAPPLL